MYKAPKPGAYTLRRRYERLMKCLANRPSDGDPEQLLFDRAFKRNLEELIESARDIGLGVGLDA